MGKEEPLYIPNSYPTLTPNERRFIFLQCCAFVALLFGIKLWLIGAYGNATPFWDQWDGEAENLYKPFLDGTLTWAHMFAPHNEHRIFTTRVLALALLTINKTWNPLLQMVVNAALHIFVVLFSIRLLLRVTGRHYLPAMLAFSLILFSIPYAWENTLAAFQSQFYFVLLFSLATIWLTVMQQPFSAKWWGGIVCSILAYLSLASGVFALAAAAAVNLIFFLGGLRRNGRQLLSIALLSALFIIGMWLTPNNPGHAVLKASSFRQFYDALLAVLGWPIKYNIVAAVLRNAPALILSAIMIWKRPPANDRRWFLVALTVWSFGQATSIAYGRASMSLSSRYMDLFALTILVNFACLIVLARSFVVKRRNLTVYAVCGWVGIIMFTLGWYGGKYVPGELAAKHDNSLEQEKNTRAYLATGDFSYLKDKPLLHIPYPDAGRLASILASPELREILPADINHSAKCLAVTENPAGSFIKNGYYQTTPKNIDTTLGSYTVQGNGTMGQATLTYSSKVANGVVEVPVAGYPLNKGMKLEIEEGGQRIPMTVENNPQESWGVAHAILFSNQFSIVVTDSSNTTWLAVGPPSVRSRLDSFTDRLLSHYYLVLIIGFIILVLLLLPEGFAFYKDTHPNESNVQ